MQWGGEKGSSLGYPGAIVSWDRLVWGVHAALVVAGRIH